ncbi:wobble nucleotide-excising tRNase [Trueperella bonasi]|uniref:Wobble nucleotide-excising tRNase n=1 Tax=Trueperella bonasi TaxID=312286 RepID=A0ABT9NI66_9ACTO|nr:AAA family ATPase [Trueperella bonasi]MDP9806895.1 wobble nucleotide-excising tRNase [Trueperella bonasi]
MIQVKSNESLRNVAKDSLVGIQLLTDSVFFGINGAGKTTVCEVLSRATTFDDKRKDNSEPILLYAFDDQWRRDKVGDFIEGGAAQGVTTVVLSDDAGDLEKKMRIAQEEWESARKDVAAKQEEEDDKSKSLEGIVEKVANGVREDLKEKCANLGGRQFQRREIRALLERGEASPLAQNEVQENIRIANSDDPGFLPDLPNLPDGWVFSDELWQKTAEKSSTAQTVAMAINDWVREGMNRHKVGDSCQFCGGEVSAQRLVSLENAIREVEAEAPALVKSELGECKSAISALKAFEVVLKGTNLDTSIYSSELSLQKAEVLLEVQAVLVQLDDSANILGDRVRDPYGLIQGDKPDVRFSALQAKYNDLQGSHDNVSAEIAKHSANKESAIVLLKKHCCAVDGAGWSEAKKARDDAAKAKQTAQEAERAAKKSLDKLKKQVSTTAATAEFLDKALCMILGDGNLRVSEGDTGEGYRITRQGEKAIAMSEGEKKLVSLLYFCAEFLAEDRKQSLKNSVVIFDDLGSELDEARLLAVDRFISGHFQNPKPASLVYFTHSHTYLKILQSRLSDKAVPKKNGEAPKAVFYEVYKDTFGCVEQSTRCRRWDNDAVRLTNDYWLSFYMVLRAFEDLQDGNPPELGTGNFCRKVLEGFTEFRAPNSDQFGSRIDTIVAQEKISMSPALSKIVNNLSHTDLNRSGGVLSRNEVELAVIQTLNFLQIVDPKHFRALLVKFRGKEGAKKLESDISLRIDRAIAIDL